jgi:acetyl-CoA carboxylase biotin carboxyl carrier protein
MPAVGRPLGGVLSLATDALVEVKAPISGIVYRAPAPGAAEFVEVGTPVKKGQVLALLEAMKVFSKIKSPTDGIVREIVARNAEAVATGQLLFVLERISA